MTFDKNSDFLNNLILVDQKLKQIRYYYGEKVHSALLECLPEIFLEILNSNFPIEVGSNQMYNSVTKEEDDKLYDNVPEPVKSDNEAVNEFLNTSEKETNTLQASDVSQQTSQKQQKETTQIDQEFLNAVVKQLTLLKNQEK